LLSRATFQPSLGTIASSSTVDHNTPFQYNVHHIHDLPRTTSPRPPGGGSFGFCPVPRSCSGLAWTPPSKAPADTSSSDGVGDDKDNSLLEFLLDEVLQHEEEEAAGGLLFSNTSYLVNNVVGDDLGDADLGDLVLPTTFSRSISCLSMSSDVLALGDLDGLEDLVLPGACDRSMSGQSVTSEGLAAIMFDVDDLSSTIDRTCDWMMHDTAADKCCVEDVTRVEDCVEDIEDVTGVEETSRAEETSRVLLTSAPMLPVPSTSSTDWSTYVYQPSLSSTGTCVVPRPSREIFMEGMVFPLSHKKQKIARYLEKRKRRLSGTRRPRESAGEITYKPRREIANKRARHNGRFVSVSEFGAAPPRGR